MGLGSDLNDVSSDSIPLLFLALVAACLAHLRSILLHFLGLTPLPHPDSDWADVAAATSGPEPSLSASGLAELIALAEQMNGAFEYEEEEEGEGEGWLRCTVCLSRVKGGEQVRRLGCSHLFHRWCLDGWVDHLNLSCPLCRAPMVSEDLVALTELRLAAGELFPRFARLAATPLAVGPSYVYDD